MLHHHTKTGQLIALFVLLTALSAGCSSATKPDAQPVEAPDYANDPVLRLAQHISSRTDAVVVVRSIEDLVDQTHQVVNAAKSATGSDKPTARLDVISQRLHIEFDSLDSWKETGLRTDTPIFLALGDDPVLVAELADEKQFYRYLERLYDAEAGIGDDSWTVKDGIVHVALDATSALAPVAYREDAFSTGSLTEDAHFRTFREQTLGDHLVGLYVPRGSEWMGETITEVVRDFSRRRGPLARHILWSAFGHVQGFGMAAGIEAGSVRAKAWLGLTDEARRQASAFVDSPRAQQWDQHLLEDATLFWGSSVDPKLGWDWIAYAMKSKTRHEMREAFEKLRAKNEIDFDIERDLVNYLSGHSALMVYPLDKKAPRYASMAFDGFGMIFMFTFTDPVVPKHLAQVIQDATAEQRHGAATLRLAGGQNTGGSVQVIDFGHVHMPKIYVKDTLVAFASSAFDEATMVELFNNTDRSKRLAHSDAHALAKTMFSSVEENALYLNATPFFDTLRQRHGEEFGPWADLLDEALVTVRVSHNGLVAEGELRSAAALGFAPHALNREILEDQVRSARSRLRNMTRQITSYYGGRQKTCSDPQSCPEPWHAGLPRRYVTNRDQKVFPGGLNQEWQSHPQVPKAARPTELAPTARQHAEATMEMLGLREQTSSSFRFTYITNGVAGPGAQVILRAEADFDPSTPEHHVLEQTMTVEDDGRITTSPIVETHEFE